MSRILQQPYFLCCILTVVLSGCSSAPVMIQPQINGLIVAGRTEYALKILNNNEAGYGPNNRLLYFMDLGMIHHQAGNYHESIQALESAKRIYDDLYTVSLTKKGRTWLVNDYSYPYVGEDFERVMINVIQAVNFAVTGDYESALVEARDVNIELQKMNDAYEADQKNVYRDDAFARMLMGLLYEARDRRTDDDDAIISYRKALEEYEGDYAKQYHLNPPDLLVRNLLALTKVYRPEEFRQLRSQFPDLTFYDLKEKRAMATVNLIQYHGFVPIKHQASIPIPVDDGRLIKIAFPVYTRRELPSSEQTFRAFAPGGLVKQMPTVEVQDISAIAVKNLESRRVRMMAKNVLRTTGKFFAAKALENTVEEEWGRNTSRLFRYAANIYQLSSEQADLRGWNTLPGEIRMASFVLKEGTYDFYLGDDKLKTLNVQNGKTYFLVTRTGR